MSCVVVQTPKTEVVISVSRPSEIVLNLARSDVNITLDVSCKGGGMSPMPDYNFYIAGEAIEAYTVVYEGDDNLLYRLDTSITDDRSLQVKGILVNVVDTGSRGQVQLSGELFNSAWNWTPELPVYVGDDGKLTQTPATVGLDLRIGMALNVTTVFIDVEEPIIILP